MWMQDLVFALPILACVIFAFAPATLVAIIVRPFSDELDAGRRTEKLRASLLAIVATAFVFIVGLSTNTLWRETSGFLQHSETSPFRSEICTCW